MTPLADPALPGLSTALDVSAVIDLLAQALSAESKAPILVKGRISEVRYQPGVTCVLLYKLKIRPEEGARSIQQLVAGRLLRVDERPTAPPAEMLARYRARAECAFPAPTLYLPQAHMVVFAFPFDVRLPWLFDVLDPSAMKRRLNELWGERGVRVCSVRARPLGYTPLARAAVRYDILAEAKGSGLPERRRLVGKIHARKAATKRFAGSWALWRAADGRVELAPPVGYIQATNLSLHELVDGERLGDLAGSPSFAKSARRTARAIATMHNLQLLAVSRRTPRKEATIIQRWANLLSAVLPDQARRIDSLRQRLVGEVEARLQMKGPVHGDFHLANVMVDDDRVMLIDLDALAYGDPLVDVGRFLSSLRTPALRVLGDLSGLREAGETFLEEYLRRSGEDERRARLFEAASLVLSATTPFRLQRGDWQETVALLLDEAERVLNLAGCGVAGRLRGEAREPAELLGDPTPWITDGTYMQAVLAPQIQEHYGAELRACHATTTRQSANGCRVRYHLRGQLDGQEWRLQLDGSFQRERNGRRAYERLVAVREALDGRADVPLLPRPVAYLKVLNLQLVEAPDGVCFHTFAEDAPKAAARVASALAAFHDTGLALDKSYSLEKERLAARRSVDNLKAGHPGLHTRACTLLSELDEQPQPSPTQLRPILRGLSPHSVLLQDERVAITDWQDITSSHPYIDVAEFLARLTQLGIERRREQEMTGIADHFRRAYMATASVSGDGMAAFEARALLRLACRQPHEGTRAVLAERLLDCAEARLVTCSDPENGAGAGSRVSR